ncbi:hypothetical protein MARPU_10310 [Marichromatium purpuratum 984]|uniref:DUF1841 domain-containing protein n=1 Tax=Marichromatium purpuratum 984 TaxID=765910 RepID=W0E0I4_MARPU|nr:DUF1841 family protein [Marichromatium purpuratum]AHF04197.1 hypothetical protein MARPU_10310 [Marichromatium purpuratum 984]
MFSDDRQSYRSAFVTAWRKAAEEQPLDPTETQIVAVARAHPEYHALLEAGDDALDRDFLPEHGETNPFLHMGLHMAVLDQLGTDQPRGIRARYQTLVARLGDTHAAEHRVMECLAQTMWRLQREPGATFDETTYLDCIGRSSKPGKSRKSRKSR